MPADLQEEAARSVLRHRRGRRDLRGNTAPMAAPGRGCQSSAIRSKTLVKLKSLRANSVPWASSPTRTAGFALRATRPFGYYATSVAQDERSTQELCARIRDHWSAIENGVHYRRAVSFGEDQCQVHHRTGAEMLAALRNLAIAVYELEVEKGRTQASSLRNWMKGQTFTSAHAPLRR